MRRRGRGPAGSEPPREGGERTPGPKAVLGVSVFLGTLYTWLVFGGPFLPFELALYALMGFGPAALVVPFWRGLEVSETSEATG